jgi:branched-chain amino acid transport system permease protein
MDFPLTQTILNSLVLGAVYVLAASGMSLLFGVSRIFNFAHGEFYMIGAYVTYLLYGVVGFPYVFALVIAMVVTGGLGMVMDTFFFRKIRGQVTPALVLSFGLAMLLSGTALQIFGERDKAVASAFTGRITGPGFSIPNEKLGIVVASLIIMVALWFYIQRTKQGRAIRAVAQDSEVAEAYGVNVNGISLLSFSISTALAGAAGVLVAPVYFVEPFMGSGIILKLLIVVVLGGLGTIQGAAVGGLILGFIEGFSVMLIGGLGYIPGFVAMMIILLVRPWGLMGIKE